MFLGIKILNVNYNDVFKASNPNSEKKFEAETLINKISSWNSQKKPGPYKHIISSTARQAFIEANCAPMF